MIRPPRSSPLFPHPPLSRSPLSWGGGAYPPVKVFSAPGRDDTALRRSSRILVLPTRRSSARRSAALKDPSALGTQGRPPRKRIARRLPPGRLQHGFGACSLGSASRPRPAGDRKSVV